MTTESKHTLQELAQVRDLIHDLHDLRVELIREAVRDGKSTRMIGRAAGYSHARVQQIANETEGKPPFISDDVRAKLLKLGP